MNLLGQNNIKLKKRSDQMNKKVILIMFALMLIFGVFIGSVFDIPRTAYAEEQNPLANTISVQGTATVKASPSLAYIHIGVSTFNKDATKAQQENASKMTTVISSLKKIGIADNNIKTTSYTLSPKYDWIQDSTGNGKSVLTGYNVNNSIQVTLKDLTQVSKVLDISVEQGVNEASSIVYDLSDEEREDLYIKALKIAAVKAKDKASALASVYNITLGKPGSLTVEFEKNSYEP